VRRRQYNRAGVSSPVKTEKKKKTTKRCIEEKGTVIELPIFESTIAEQQAVIVEDQTSAWLHRYWFVK
jgi:hypothetical protein